MKTARWEESAIAWLAMTRPPPVPPDDVVMGLAAAGVYKVSAAGAKRRGGAGQSRARRLDTFRNSQMRSRWKKRIRMWLKSDERAAGKVMEVDVDGENSWTAEIERREAGFMLPVFSTIECVRKDEIRSRKRLIYRPLVHHHDGAEWLW